MIRFSSTWKKQSKNFFSTIFPLYYNNTYVCCLPTILLIITVKKIQSDKPQNLEIAKFRFKTI